MPPTLPAGHGWVTVAMGASDDRGLDAVLAALGVRPDHLLGCGGEARVYAMDQHRVLRVLHDGQDEQDVRARQRLVRELGSRGAPFLLPEVLTEGQAAGRCYSIERRLPGRSVNDALEWVEGRARVDLIERYLAAAAALGSLHLDDRGWFGELIGQQPVRAVTWRDYLHERAAASLRRSTAPLRRLDPASLCTDLPDVAVPAFVHLDAYAGNMLTADGAITAVLDIGVTSVAGDPRFDPIAAAVYLSTPLITPASTPADEAVAVGWLRAAGLLHLLEPVRRWLAAYWAFAVKDRKLHRWCQSVLLPGT